jgi:hypothetical protein
MAQGKPRHGGHKDPISKITSAQWTAGVAQAVEHLFCKCISPEFKPQPHQKKKEKLSKSLNIC